MTREEYFCKEYVDKLYYFCLKKTGNVIEAEDLCSEISLEILAAWKKGIIPEHLDGWIWKIARNRYARWANNKHIRREKEEMLDDEVYAQLADDTLLEQQVIEREQIQELRRELSLISKEFREILVAYYVEDKKISAIAKALSIPEGTVKTKLFKARQKLKEGMKMARTFGKLSYAPEEIEFSKSGRTSSEWEPDKYLWDKLYCKICKNILIEAYRNPVTMQELSIELGIAMPYLENFVEEMAKSTLLIKNGKNPETATYETNFVIISGEAMRKMNDKLAQIQKRFVRVAKEYLEKSRELQLAAGNHILGQYQDYEEQKWTLTFRLADDVQWAVYDKRNLQFHYDTVRPNGGTWDVMGIQRYDGPSFMWVGHSYGDADECENITAFFTERHLESYKMDCVDRANVEILNAIIRGQDSVSQRELANLEKKGFIRKNKDGIYEITFGLYSKAHNSETLRYGVPIAIYDKELLPLWNQLMDIAEEYVAYCEEVMRAEIPKRLMTQFNFCMHSIPFLRGMLAEGLVESGFIKPEEELSEMIGVYSIV